MSLTDIVKRLFGASAADETATHWLKASDFGYPYSIVSPAQAPEALRAEDAIGAREGFTPIIIVSEIWNRRRVAPKKRTKRALKLLRGKCDATRRAGPWRQNRRRACHIVGDAAEVLSPLACSQSVR
jgi:hypothetical protein